MKKRKKFIVALLVSFFGFGAGYLLINSFRLGFCGYSSFCYNSNLRIGHTTYYSFASLSFVFFLLTIFPKTFSVWKYFGYWFIPLAAILLVFYPNPGSGDFLAIYPSMVARWVSEFFAVVSACIIMITAIAQKIKRG